jgi:sigma-B regulation protein RsbU (phosphoserine phosphatase)
MIQKIMDSVEYVSWAGQNELRMSKRLTRDTGEGVPPMFRRMLGLRMKFSLWTFFIVSLIIAGAFYYVDRQTTEEIYRHIDGIARALGETIAEQSALYSINHRSDVEFDELVVSYQSSNDMVERIVLVDSLGVILAHSDDIRNIRKPYRRPGFADPGFTDSPQRTMVNDQEINYLALPISSGDRLLGKVCLTYSSEPVNRRLVESRNSVLIVTLLLISVGVLGIYLLSNYFVRPIVNITRRVRRFTRGDLESELPLEGAAEFFEISSALNEMMTRLRRDRETLIEQERLAKEIEVASQIQKTLLPKRLPDLSGLEIDAFYRAASVIGGDLYDVFEIDDDRCCLIVADVSGKGVPASLVMSMLRTVIKIHLRDAGSAKNILVAVNEYLTENIPKGMFITVLMGIYHASTRRVNLVSAGHNPLLLYRAATGEVARLNPAGMPLGVPPTSETHFADAVEEIELVLNEGDAFILYTDGITEAENREGQQYGMDRLQEFMAERWKKGSENGTRDLAHDLVAEIDAYSGFAAQRDDITFILGRTVPRDRDEMEEESLSRATVDHQTLDDADRDQDSGD